jgi:hypothetical protein
MVDFDWTDFNFNERRINDAPLLSSRKTSISDELWDGFNICEACCKPITPYENEDITWEGWEGDLLFHCNCFPARQCSLCQRMITPYTKEPIREITFFETIHANCSETAKTRDFNRTNGNKDQVRYDHKD